MDMMVHLSYRGGKTKDKEKVAEVLSGYELEGVQFLLDEQGNLEVAVENVDGQEYGEEWPRAVKKDQLPDRDKYPDQVSWWDAVFKVFSGRGDEGFEALLGELAPLLATPLIILASELISDSGSAQLWRIAPGASEVETFGVHIGWPG